MLSESKHNATCYSSLVKTEDWVMLGPLQSSKHWFKCHSVQGNHLETIDI